MDERLKLLSYSSLLTLHSCPRKYQLYRLNVEESDGNSEAALSQNVTFAFGHVVGDGIQKLFAGMDLDSVIFQTFLGWHADLEDRNIKQNKSVYHAIAALQRFASLRENGLLEDYELMYHGPECNTPAIELSFRISFPDGFKMRGSVDAVLKNKHTDEVMVLECKTSSSTSLNPATYKNSAQGVGYSVVLDTLCPGISSYKVLYLVYLTKDMSYEQFSFPKSYLQRALWIQELLLDIETIKLYDTAGVFPMRGESCLEFFRECEYLNVCNLATQYLTKPIAEGAILDDKIYDVEIGLLDLLKAQLDKNDNWIEADGEKFFTKDVLTTNTEGDVIL